MTEHITVFEDKDTFAGWPANHGAWQWGDEFLVGFMRGGHSIGYGIHNIARPYQKLLSRSLDGGLTWTTEDPGVDFSAKTVEWAQAPSFELGGDTIIRVCGVYDTGGADCNPSGGFYLSHDRGKTWRGAFSFELKRAFSGELHNTSRTSVLEDKVFLTFARRHHWGTDGAFMCRVEDGKFVDAGLIASCDEGRFVMPRAARVGDRIVVVARRLGWMRAGGWIDAVISDDNGRTWGPKVFVGATGSNNGNPPALINWGDVLYCAYANRDRGQIMLSHSADGGATWVEDVLRDGGDSDIGYPQLFKRQDGRLVCVYYWTESEGRAQRIEATVIP